ncbi:hypothetical protein [Trichlorobacter lovleyi]|uniref:hypothetical protein n=1 Tax=Trichlorobacter lovleyi TaxID=313985 RepID=UPI0024810DB0|nr:hypothetical protein [Trichlorobacter lovleyi]
MNRISALSACILVLFTAGLCSADSLVITYRSGKTQTVSLDEPSTTINSWQFVAGATAATPQQPPQLQQAAPAKAGTDEPNKDTKKTAEKAPDKKSGVRFMWNAPPIKD